MARKSSQSTISLVYPKLLTIGDEIEFMHAGDWWKDRTYQGKTLMKAGTNDARRERVMYGIWSAGGFVKGDDDEYEAITESEEQIAFTVNGTTLFLLSKAIKKLPAYGPVLKGTSGDSGAMMVKFRFRSNSVALNTKEGGDKTRLYAKFLKENEGVEAAFAGEPGAERLVFSSVKAARTFKSWMDDQPNQEAPRLGKDIIPFVRRPKPEEIALEELADAFAEEREAAYASKGEAGRSDRQAPPDDDDDDATTRRRNPNGSDYDGGDDEDPW